MLLADLINYDYIIPLACFGAFAAGAWWLMGVLAAGKPRAVERLDELRQPRARRDGPELKTGKRTDAVTRVLEKASPKLAAPLQPKSDLERSRLKIRLANAGFRNEAAPSIFLGLKFIGLLVGLFCGGGTVLLSGSTTPKTLMTAMAVIGGFFYLPELVLALIGRSRKQAIFLGLPDALDLMVVCVEAGLGLDQAMRKVAEEMKKTHPVIAEEFGLANLQLQMGRQRAEVLHELGVRSGVDDLRGLAAILIQADKLGASIAQALRVQSDSMRTRRRQIAEEKAAKTAVQLIFPLVLFIFPGIFVVLVGPAAILYMNQMAPKMSGG